MKDLEEKQENGGGGEGEGEGEGEGSVSSESSFRELDDVFLQTQTRIWLGEVLHTRLDEQLHVADLLADGELLFEVSREVWEMLLRIRTELRGVKLHRYEPFACRKVSRRYLPYSNVDSFLKICKLVGLSGIDLFSPSDVVEKKDTRKVCMCIRSLSKKARSRHLNVPDFDVVTYTVAMPTTMVGCMRRSWELSRCSSSNSVGDSSYHKSRQKSSQKHPNSALGQHCNSFSGEYSDDAESKFMSQSYSSMTKNSYNTSQINSSGVSLLDDDYSYEKEALDLGAQNHRYYDIIESQLGAVSLNNSVRSLGSWHLEFDNQLDGKPTLSFTDSNTHLGDEVYQTESAARSSCENTALDTTFVDPNLEDDFSVVEDCGDGGGTPRSHVDDNLTLLCDIDPGTYASDSIMLDGKDSMFHSSASTSSSTSKATGEILKSEFTYRCSGVDEEEVSSVSSMSAVSGVARSLDLDDHLGKVPPESQDSKSALMCKTYTEGSKFPDMVVCETSKDISTCANGAESLLDMKAQYSNGCADHGICMSESISYVAYKDRKVFASQLPLPKESHQWDQKGKCGIPTLPIGFDGHGASSLFLSQVDAHDEMQTKDTGFGFWQTNAKPFISNNNEGGNGVLMYESNPYTGKQLNKWFETASFDDKKERDNCEDSLCYTVASCIPVELTPEEHTSSVEEHSHEKKDPIYHLEHKENENHERVQTLAFEESAEMVNLSAGSAKSKSQSRSSILVSVARGAAVFGVMFLLLHLRKNGGENTDELGGQSNEVRNRKAKGRQLSSPKRRKESKVAGVYPSENLKL